MKKTNERKMIFCEPCSFKMIIEPEEELELPEIKTAPVPAGIPQLDVVTNKTKFKEPIKQNKKLKCPKCGRGVVVKKLQDAYTKTFKTIDDEKEKERIEADRKQRLEDGKPHEKKIDPDFWNNNEKKNNNPRH